VDGIERPDPETVTASMPTTGLAVRLLGPFELNVAGFFGQSPTLFAVSEVQLDAGNARGLPAFHFGQNTKLFQYRPNARREELSANFVPRESRFFKEADGAAQIASSNRSGRASRSGADDIDRAQVHILAAAVIGRPVSGRTIHRGARGHSPPRRARIPWCTRARWRG
jgi:hypothetical protein